MTASKKRYIIVGGVAGGATAAARIRRMTEDAEIILFEKGKYRHQKLSANVSISTCGQ